MAGLYFEHFNVRITMKPIPLLLCVGLLAAAACRFNGELSLPGADTAGDTPAAAPETAPTQPPFACRQVRPSEAGATITQWDQPHYVCPPASQDREDERLFVFLPGTGATPDYYTQLMHAAAEAGLHVIDLRYPNDESVNLQICPWDDDPDCHEKVRREILLGVDVSRHVSVDAANSIEGRLASALAFLTSGFPEEGWEQFLGMDGEITWSSVVVAGHSQGGGHAVFLAREHEVARAVAFAWVDVRKGELAPWLVSSPSQTPPEDYYLFWHQGDTRVARHQQHLMGALGIDTFGAPVVVDGNVPPYNGSHALVATIPPPEGERAHNTHVVDMALTYDVYGEPNYKNVWEFLLVVDRQPQDLSSPHEDGFRTANAVRIGASGVSYTDPEFYSYENLVTFADEDRRAWLGALNPASGDFVSTDGRDTLVDDDLTPLSVSFNAPEFGVDREGWALFYTKHLYGVPQVWRATLEEGDVTSKPLTTGGVPRLSVLASKDPALSEARLLYALGGFSPQVGQIGWLEEGASIESETAVAPVDRGARWIDGTATFTFVAPGGQVALYDTATGVASTITDSPEEKSYTYGWLAPEYDELLVMAVVDGARVEIYRDIGETYWERVLSLEIPADSPYTYIGSPEPFTAGGRSYLSLVAKASEGYAEAEVWVWAVFGGESGLRLRCEDGQGQAVRSDPEAYAGQEEVFVYYNLLRAGWLGGRSFELYRCSTGLAP
jgi:hypothetical protein